MWGGADCCSRSAWCDAEAPSLTQNRCVFIIIELNYKLLSLKKKLAGPGSQVDSQQKLAPKRRRTSHKDGHTPSDNGVAGAGSGESTDAGAGDASVAQEGVAVEDSALVELYAGLLAPLLVKVGADEAVSSSSSSSSSASSSSSPSLLASKLAAAPGLPSSSQRLVSLGLASLHHSAPAPPPHTVPVSSVLTELLRFDTVCRVFLPFCSPWDDGTRSGRGDGDTRPSQSPPSSASVGQARASASRSKPYHSDGEHWRLVLDRLLARLGQWLQRALGLGTAVRQARGSNDSSSEARQAESVLPAAVLCLAQLIEEVSLYVPMQNFAPMRVDMLQLIGMPWQVSAEASLPLARVCLRLLAALPSFELDQENSLIQRALADRADIKAVALGVLPAFVGRMTTGRTRAQQAHHYLTRLATTIDSTASVEVKRQLALCVGALLCLASHSSARSQLRHARPRVGLNPPSDEHSASLDTLFDALSEDMVQPVSAVSRALTKLTAAATAACGRHVWDCGELSDVSLGRGGGVERDGCLLEVVLWCPSCDGTHRSSDLDGATTVPLALCQPFLELLSDPQPHVRAHMSASLFRMLRHVRTQDVVLRSLGSAQEAASKKARRFVLASPPRSSRGSRRISDIGVSLSQRVSSNRRWSGVGVGGSSGMDDSEEEGADEAVERAVQEAAEDVLRRSPIASMILGLLVDRAKEVRELSSLSAGLLLDRGRRGGGVLVQAFTHPRALVSKEQHADLQAVKVFCAALFLRREASNQECEAAGEQMDHESQLEDIIVALGSLVAHCEGDSRAHLLYLLVDFTMDQSIALRGTAYQQICMAARSAGVTPSELLQLHTRQLFPMLLATPGMAREVCSSLLDNSTEALLEEIQPEIMPLLILEQRLDAIHELAQLNGTDVSQLIHTSLHRLNAAMLLNTMDNDEIEDYMALLVRTGSISASSSVTEVVCSALEETLLELLYIIGGDETRLRMLVEMGPLGAELVQKGSAALKDAGVTAIWSLVDLDSGKQRGGGLMHGLSPSKTKSADERAGIMAAFLHEHVLYLLNDISEHIAQVWSTNTLSQCLKNAY